MTSSRVNKLENTKATCSVFSKCAKFNAHFKNLIKTQQEIFCFSYKCIWIGNCRLSALSRKYLLTSCLKASDGHKNDFFQLNLAQNEENVRWKGSPSDMSRMTAYGFCEIGSYMH